MNRRKLLFLPIASSFSMLLGCSKSSPGASGTTDANISDSGGGTDTANDSGKEIDAPDEDWLGYSTSFLTKQGYQPKTADAVARMNESCFKIWIKENKKELNDHLTMLARLSSSTKVQERLFERPELASLLAGAAAIDAHAVDSILATTANEADFMEISSLYQIAAAPEERVEIANVLKLDGDVIIRARKRGVLDPVSWFMNLPGDPNAAMIYRKWVRSVFEDALNQEDPVAPVPDAKDQDVPYSKMQNAETILNIHSATVRKLLNENRMFREQFLSIYWPKFRNILERFEKNDLEWGNHVADDRFWEYCAKYSQKEADIFDLFEKYGATATDLLLDPDYQEVQRRAFVREALKLGDNNLISALSDPNLRTVFQFHKLIERKVPLGTKRIAIEKLTGNHREMIQKLDYFQGITDNSLIEDLGPEPAGVTTWIPGYSVYHLGRKMAQGREAGTIDFVNAGLDGGLTLLTFGVGSGFLTTAKSKIINSMGKWVLIDAAVEVIEKGTAKELYPWVIREGFRTMQVLTQKIAANSTVELTKLTQVAFQQSGLGRVTFKRLTGLEARVFMRSDRRVLIDLPTVVFGKNGEDGLDQLMDVFEYALEETATNAGLETAINSPTGKIVIEEGVKTAVISKEVAEKQYYAWRQHLSTWWLLNNDSKLMNKIDMKIN